jgi:serine protease inhibitor
MAGVGDWLHGVLGTKQSVEPVETPGSLIPHPPMRPKSLVSFARGNNDFALALFGQLRQRPGNLFFSPFSIRTALGLAHAGARGETGAEMSKALCIASHDEMANSAALAARLTANGGKYEASVANSLWSQQGAPILSEFLDIVRSYRSGINQIDFRDGDVARARINKWVSDETRQRIRDLIPSGSLDGSTRLALVNAVYFKGLWLMQFHEQATREAPFYLADGDTVRASLMHQRQWLRYAKGSMFQAVELVYRGQDVSMVVFLPDRRGALPDLEAMLSPDLIRDCVGQMEVREVELSLPRFSVRWGTENVIYHLAALGMRLALAPSQADFSGINGHRPPDPEALFFSAVYHQALVDVNEEGTEATAATAAMVHLGADFLERLAVPIVRADHPFLVAIRERPSGAILFLGRVTDPTAVS